MAEGTPMMNQYNRIKKELSDCILFFRLGDFYEMFNEDAIVVSKELNLTLTTRDRTRPKEEQTPMCGVPYHAYESYVAKLLSKGYKVAICEQTEDPALAKGLVQRDILRIITPGTVIESSMLEERKPTYLGTVCLFPDSGVCCFADLSTGEFLAAEFRGTDSAGHLQNELVRYAPAEVLMNHAAASNIGLRELLTKRMKCMVQTDDGFDADDNKALFEQHFGHSETDSRELISAAGLLLNYLHQTQKVSLAHINQLTRYSSGCYMELDWQTRRNLELTETLRSGERKGSLLWVLDKTQTAMGSRTLRSWVEKPLLSPTLILRRLNAVSELTDNEMTLGELREALKQIDDLERLIGRVVYGNANSRDLGAIASSCAAIPKLRELLAPMKSGMLRDIRAIPDLSEICEKITSALGDNLPVSVRDGGMIRPGFSEDVDSLRALSGNAKGAVEAMEERERERTGYKKLKIGYNKVFGYYIELPKAMADSAPADYIRKQTLVNGERYITEELKELESRLLTAHDRLRELEFSLFSALLSDVAAQAESIRTAAIDIAVLDSLCSLAHVALRNHYCLPDVDLSGVIDIQDGRHPVVELARTDALFVPNSVRLDAAGKRAAIITGPNMAGKSTYMRQTALIVLLAQIGSFVPAKSARIGIVDRIFTRIGASDDLSSGQSTFMVEMNEVSQILQNATSTSLLILDEIGRGTSTYDGMSIARAVLEYCANPRHIGARTMFATHYHELTTIENDLAGVFNLSTAVKKRGEDIIFLRRIVPGGADRSYGVEVAKLAGIPDSVIRRARNILRQLEDGSMTPSIEESTSELPEEPVLPVLPPNAEEILDKLRELDLNTLTPLEAINYLFRLKQLLQ